MALNETLLVDVINYLLIEQSRMNSYAIGTRRMFYGLIIGIGSIIFIVFLVLLIKRLKRRRRKPRIKVRRRK